MEDDKIPRKDIYKNSELFLYTGLIVSLIIVISAIEYNSGLPYQFLKMEKAIMGQEADFSFEMMTQKIPEKYVINAEENASFPGGCKEYSNFIHQSLEYPFVQKLEGRVMVSMIVETDGCITHAKVIEGMAREYDKEALRLVRAFPKWNPAIDKGKPVRQLVTLPIIFKLKS